MKVRYNVISDIARRKKSSYSMYFLTEKDAEEWTIKYIKAKTVIEKIKLLPPNFKFKEDADEWVENFRNSIPTFEQAWTGIFDSEKEADIWYEKYGKYFEKQGYKFVRRETKSILNEKFNELDDYFPEEII